MAPGCTCGNVRAPEDILLGCPAGRLRWSRFKVARALGDTGAGTSERALAGDEVASSLAWLQAYDGWSRTLPASLH